MSHLGTRLLADRFADPADGVNALVQEMTGVLHDGDELPSSLITVYDDTRTGWAARTMVPLPSTGVNYPLIRVFTQGAQYDSGVPAIQSTQARTVSGTLNIVAQLILRGDDSADDVTAGMYWLRAMRGVVVRFDDPALYDDAAHQACGIQLRQCSSITQGNVDAKLGDTLVSCGALLLSYPFIETVPLPLLP